MSRPVSGFMEPHDIAPVMMTVPEVARYLNVPPNTIYSMIHRGRFQCQGIKVGRVWRFNRESVEDFSRFYKRYRKRLAD